MHLLLFIFFFFFKQKTAYEMLRSLVGSEMCIRDRAKRKKKRDKQFKMEAKRSRRPKDIFHEKVKVVRHASGCPDPAIHDTLSMMWEWETIFEFPSPPSNEENWCAYGPEISMILEDAHQDFKKRVDVNVNGIYLRFWLQARFQEDLRTGRKSGLRRCKPGIGLYTVTPVDDDACDNPEDRALKKKLLSGGEYSRAEYLRLIESGKLLQVEQTWDFSTLEPPILGEDLVRDHYYIASQGGNELERIQERIAALKVTSEDNKLQEARMQCRRGLMKKKFEEINAWMLADHTGEQEE
eukprot:TRINITY_DN6200_c0_g1_i4.p1 TRINITY_DN6200_c0_g1~~TRINITY_DN6200_c0_g1_i4.p1  ORF type:complete len:295 (-),score=75.80 TRINITY_DN6200_c0_g1_i4:266-1150(-)